MRKQIITGLSMLMMFPVSAQSDVNGLWISDQKPGWYVTLQEAPGTSGRFIGMQVLDPSGTDWDIFVGPESPDDVADLGPAVTDSDMQSRWTSTNDNNGTLEVQSCTQNCPFKAGETIQWVKIYGETVDPEGGEPDPEQGSIEVDIIGKGVVTSRPFVGSCDGPGSCDFKGPVGTVVTLIAIPEDNWDFDDWGGCGGDSVQDPVGGLCQQEIQSDKTHVEANFQFF